MPHLQSSDIRYIRLDLRRRGLVHSPLQDELVDHVCCEVEEIIARHGTPFKEAYEQVLRDLDDRQVNALQNQTFQSENYTPFMLLRNNFRIMLRTMVKNGSFTMINIGGLALGLLCFIIILVYVKHELTYDTAFSRSPDIYRITMSSTVGRSTNHIPTSYPTLGPALKEQFAGIDQYVRIINYKYTRMTPTFTYQDKVFYEDNVIFADSTFLQVFDFPMAEGNAATALQHPASVVITEKAAQKYFGLENALGKHLRFNATTDLEVTGVLRDLPSNTHLQFDFLIPMSGLKYSGAFRTQNVLENWGIDWFWTYLVIPDSRTTAQVIAGMDKLTDEKIPDYKKENQARFYLQPLRDVHLKSDFDYNTDLTQNGDYTSLYIFASAGVLVLLISGINFINITMAMASRRYKEIGISKVLGAYKNQLRLQFMSEAIITSLLALIIAFLALPLMLPAFSGLLGTGLHFGLLADKTLALGIVIFTVAVGTFSGVYPAFFVSSFEPQRVLKGVWKPGTGGTRFRKLLVGTQLAISIFLIIGTIVIYRQLGFIQSKGLGFDKEQIVMLNIRGTSIPRSYFTMKQQLENESSVIKVSAVSEPVGREVQFMTFKLEGYPEDQFIKILNVTHDFVETMGLTIVQGSDFSRLADSTSGFLINEAAARAYGWTDPVGKTIKHAFPNAPEGKVVGVVKDFNFEPLHKRIDPLVIFMGAPFWYMAVKIKPGDVPGTLAHIERSWKQFEPNKPFSFHFLDQAIQNVYLKEARTSRVFLVFSMLSILTACLGLFGLIAFAMEQRLVEIGIRKVLGASVTGIVNLVLKEYLVLVLLAFVVAAPVTYLIMNRWLEGFAFRISWHALYFLSGLVLSLAIVTATIFSKAWRAARSNPVKVLRSE